MIICSETGNDVISETGNDVIATTDKLGFFSLLYNVEKKQSWDDFFFGPNYWCLQMVNINKIRIGSANHHCRPSLRHAIFWTTFFLLPMTLQEKFPLYLRRYSIHSALGLYYQWTTRKLQKVYTLGKNVVCYCLWVKLSKVYISQDLFIRSSPSSLNW